MAQETVLQERKRLTSGETSQQELPVCFKLLMQRNNSFREIICCENLVEITHQKIRAKSAKNLCESCHWNKCLIFEP